MLLSCGVDIVSVERVERIVKRYGDRFLSRVFPEGLEYCLGRKNFSACVAARFALKEAVVKAMTALNCSVRFSDIIITGGGKNIGLTVKGHKNLKFLFSISHERDYAVAVVNITER